MRTTQHGNALFLILIAVALFAALSYAITQSGKGGGNTIGKERATLDQAVAIQVGADISQAILRMRTTGGCSDEQLSFEGAGSNFFSEKNDGTLYDYTNAGTPVDGSCNIFATNGGGVAPPGAIPASLVVDPSVVNQAYLHPQAWYVSNAQVVGDGTSASDLILWVGRFTREQCLAVNNHFGVTNPGGEPPSDTFNGCGAFQGSYACVDTIGDQATELVGKADFCFDYGGGAAGYLYIHVLLER